MRKYNLLIDCSYINNIRFYPVSLALYSGRILQGFRDSKVFNVSAIVWKGMEENIDGLAGYNVDKIIVDETTKVTPWRILDRVLGLIPFKRELEKRKIDAVLMPYHFESIFFFSKKYNHIEIVQDLIPYYILKEPLGTMKYKIWCAYRRVLIRKVKNFISISKKTQEELKRFEGKDSVVVYNSIPFDFSIQEENVKEVEGKKYILDVNRFAKLKNAETLIRAFNLLKDRIPHILYLKGDDRHPEDYDNLVKLVKELNLEDRVIFDKTHRSEGEIRYLYTHADLFVTPSLMEGFGWTPIEATILKVPVITSDIDVMKEVSCGKLTTFNPYSHEDLASKMENMLSNPPSMESRKELSDFFMNKYSLKAQIDGLTNVILNTINS